MSKKTHDKKLRARNRKLLELKKTTKTDELLQALLQPQRFEDTQPPEGFRTISASQAMITFAEPLRELVTEENIDAMNQVFGIVTDIWNFTLPKVPAHQKKTQDELVENICEAFEMDESDAIDLFERMIERKAYLFPDDIQPADVRTMCMRKERAYDIKPFDETQLTLSGEEIPVSQDDQAMLEQLQRLDVMLADGEGYDAWEELYFHVEEACCTRYYEWLKAKGVPARHSNEFPYCLERFVDFVYRYNAVTFAMVSVFEMEEFLLDHLLRKVMIQPEDYVFWPPAIRLFYTFLAEKGYIENSQPFLELVHRVEPKFIELLKKQF